jgi:nicotinamidase-related amidase
MRTPAPIDLRDAALIVIDMQRYFLRPGAAAFLDPPAELVSNVLALCARFRTLGRPVIFTRHANRRDAAPKQINRWWDNDLPFEGDADTALDDRIVPAPGETVLIKETYSAFEETELDAFLGRHAVTTAVICGVMTNVCVDTTARHAFLKGYQPVVVSDACAGKDRRFHDASLLCLGYAFAPIPTTHDLL